MMTKHYHVVIETPDGDGIRSILLHF
jgi:hypothetical protein